MIIAAEIVHGITRAVLLVPVVGEFRSSQIDVFTGSMIILAIVCFSVPWIGTNGPRQLFLMGFLWLGLTLAFEILFGRLVLGLPWQRLLADYNILQGGLLPFGMLVLLLSPLIVAKLRKPSP